MKKYSIILIVILSTAISSCTKKTVILTEDTLPDDVFYQTDNIRPFTGKCIVYYDGTEIIKEELNFKKGILNGERNSYYKNGQIRRSGAYHKGDYNGKWTSYDSKGNKVYEVEYQNDTLIGRFVSWYNTGIIRETGTYRDNSKTGEWVVFDESGMVVDKELL